MQECARRLEAAASIDDPNERETFMQAIRPIPGAMLEQWRLLAADQAILSMLHNPARPSGLRPHQLDLLRATVASDCTPAEFDLFVETAEHYNLDPFRRQIMPLIIGKHQPGKRRAVILVGIDGQRLIAQRCGNYRAASEPAKFVHDKRLKGPANPLGIVLARVKLWQQDNRGEWFGVVGEAYWDEFAPLKDEWEDDPETGARRRSGRQVLDPEGNWPRMPRLMLAKCATMQALRAGWPDQYGGIYAEEEMDRARAQDLAASEIVEMERERKRLAASAGKDALTISWGDWNLENVPLKDFSERVMGWMDTSGRTASEVADWAESNREALRLFWAASPAAALELKKAIEARSKEPSPSREVQEAVA